MLGQDVYDVPKKEPKKTTHPGFKDVAGYLLKVGDIVAYNPVGKHKRLGIGEVIGFSARMVRIKTGPDYMSNGRAYPQTLTRYPKLCVKLPKGTPISS